MEHPGSPHQCRAGTVFPGDGGYVLWADAAFGAFWGSLMGSWKYLSGIINAAAYPVHGGLPR